MIGVENRREVGGGGSAYIDTKAQSTLTEKSHMIVVTQNQSDLFEENPT